MNWTIAFFIWLKGIGIFGVCCIPFLELGLWAFAIAVVISWIAIPVYAISLWLLKETRIPHKLSMGLMLLLPTASAVLAALWFLKIIDKEIVSDGEGILFWIPLVCCMLSIAFSNNSIFCYLDTTSIDHEFIIE